MITLRPSSGLFGGFSVYGFLVFALAIAIIVGSFVQRAGRRHRDDHSPQVTAEALVVTKRTHVWGDHSHTDYYATFQFASGDRLELEVPHSQFGYLVEGDHGRLTFQGTRFLCFDRM